MAATLWMMVGCIRKGLCLDCFAMVAHILMFSADTRGEIVLIYITDCLR